MKIAEWDQRDKDFDKVVDFFHRLRFNVRAVSAVNVDLSTGADNGSSFGGVNLVTNDIIAAIGQTDPAENGVYIAQASGAPIRHPDFDTPEKLTYACLFVEAGTFINTIRWQTEVTTNFSEQLWGTTRPTYYWTVPQGITSIAVEANGGGGGGGTGRAGSDGGNVSGGGGGGGAGTIPFSTTLPVTPGEVIEILVGDGGLATSPGGNTILTGSFGIVTFPGANNGTGGGSGSSAGPGGNNYTITTLLGLPPIMVGGNGAAGAVQPGTGGPGAASGSDNIFTTASAPAGVGGGVGYNGGGGGGGAPGMGIGGAGGRNSTWPSNTSGTPGSPAPEKNYGAGGGGGGGGSEIGSGPGGRGGLGANGFCRISY